jgi:hypothetical protein
MGASVLLVLLSLMGFSVDATGVACTQYVQAGSNLSATISRADDAAVLCLGSGTYDVNLLEFNRPDYVTVEPAPGQKVRIADAQLYGSSHLSFRGLRFTGGVEVISESGDIEFVNNEFTGTFGMRFAGNATSAGTEISDILIDGNNIHDIDYTGSQGTANGYGITATDGVRDFTITDNTIRSVAADYIQAAAPVDFTVERNTFLGPTLVGTHPQEHQDLWQIFGGGTNVTFADNVARHTGTHESLLFQEGDFRNVRVENNLFDHDSRGYTCQIYQSTGLVFRKNTVVGSGLGCLFRDAPPPSGSSLPGSRYQVDHNIFVGTKGSADISTEGRAGTWGSYDYNVSSDDSASGSHSVRNWQPKWANEIDYPPVGLPIEAGYRAR